MDTALKAMRRAARAILEDESSELQDRITELEADLKDALNRAEEARLGHAHTLGQLQRASAGAKQHAPHDLPLKAALEYLGQPSKPGRGFDIVCPPARWGLPKP